MLDHKSEKELRKKLKRTDHRTLDRLMHTAHENAFACTDCLDCANCCSTTGPLFTDADVRRIAKHLHLSEADFISAYLRTDEDGDQVLQSVPCHFLGPDNYCSIYEKRPKACREYPHTDRVKQFQLIELTLKNARICPAVETMLTDIGKQLE